MFLKKAYQLVRWSPGSTSKQVFLGNFSFLRTQTSIFWISAPFKFTKPVTLKVQHCALTEDETVFSDLSFVSAKCSESEPPHIFKQLEGGVFSTHRSYGSIQLWDWSVWEKEDPMILMCILVPHYEDEV